MRKRARRAALGGGWSGDSPKQSAEHLPDLWPHQAVKRRVQAAVRVRKAHGNREHVGVHHVVRFIPVGCVEFDQDTPEGDGVIWHPAAEERQNNNGDRFGDSGSPFWVAAAHAPPSHEAQEHQIIHTNYEHRDDEGDEYFLDVIECEPIVTLGEPEEAEFFSSDHSHGGEDSCRSCGHRRRHPQHRAHPLHTARPPARSLLQGRGDRQVASHTHGGEEKYAGVHVHHGDRQDDFAHGVSKRPAEVQRGVHSPEGQSEHELEVRHCQVDDEKIDGGPLSTLSYSHEEKHE